MNQHTILTWGAKATAEPGMTISHEGGAVHRVDDLTVLRRFLILGSTGTFYANGFDVTRMSMEAIERVIAESPMLVLMEVAKAGGGNLALRRDPALYVLARLTLPDVPLEVRRGAASSLAVIARTGTDLLHWIGYRRSMGKSNRLFRRAITGWFLYREPDELALQAVKYDSRDGWTMRDALRLARPTAPNEDYAAVFNWMAHPDKRVPWIIQAKAEAIDRLFVGYALMRLGEGVVTENDVARTITERRMPRETVTGEYLAHREVWEALLPDMPGRSLLRNLGKLGSLGLLDGEMSYNTTVIAKINNYASVGHPFEFLVAAKMYDQGHGIKGNLSWTPNPAITETLAIGFANAFGHLPVDETIAPLIAMDISGSMSQSAGGTVLSCVEAEAALVAVLAYQFPRARFGVFSHGFDEVGIRDRSYREILGNIERMCWSGGWTYCDLPLLVAENDPRIDAVVTITDSETAYGRIRPSRVVEKIHRQGREQFRHAVVAMATNDISIADPNDARQMDFVGMSADLPVAMAAFLRGEV